MSLIGKKFTPSHSWNDYKTRAEKNMISKQALYEFLNRKELRNHDWIKDYSNQELDEAIQELGYTCSFKHAPMQHQKASFLVSVLYSNFFISLDMGCGKTYISLMIADYLKKKGEVKKVLVVVPNRLNVTAWKEEILEHTDFTATGLLGTKDLRTDILKEDVDFYIINYEGLPVMMTDFKATKRGNRKRILNPVVASEFASNFDMVILDEIHKCRSKDSLTFKLVDFLTNKIEFRYGMSGTPLGRKPIALYSQFYVLDKGETLGIHSGIFEQAFFKAKLNRFGGMDFVLDERKKHLLYTFLKNKSIRYKDTECADLPQKIVRKIKVNLSDKGLTALKRIKKENKINLQTNQKTKNVYSKFRQICSGFLYEEDEEFGKIAIRFPENEKLDFLEEFIEELDGKCIIYYFFQESEKIISKFLDKQKIIYANSANKDIEAEYSKFKNNPECNIFLLNIASTSTGLNLQMANKMLFYEPIDDPILFQQAIKRIHRQGQTNTCFYYYLMTKDSVEENIYEFLEEGKSLFDALIDGKKSLFDLM